MLESLCSILDAGYCLFLFEDLKFGLNLKLIGLLLFLIACSNAILQQDFFTVRIVNVDLWDLGLGVLDDSFFGLDFDNLVVRNVRLKMLRLCFINKLSIFLNGLAFMRLSCVMLNDLIILINQLLCFILSLLLVNFYLNRLPL